MYADIRGRVRSILIKNRIYSGKIPPEKAYVYTMKKEK
jgi:hypothetical protein